MNYGRNMLLLQRWQARHPLPPLDRTPPRHFDAAERRAWSDVISATPPVILRSIDRTCVMMTATCVRRWRDGDHDPGLLRLTCRLLRSMFVSMPMSRALLSLRPRWP